MHILSPVTDNCSSSISGRGRGRRNVFMTKSPRKNVPDVGIELVLCVSAWGWFMLSISLTAYHMLLIFPVLLNGSNDFDTWAAKWQNQQNECAPSEDSDQPGHPPSLIRVFAVRMKKHQALIYPSSAQRRHWSDWADAQADLRRLWSDWADAQADLSLRWGHTHFVGFVISLLTFVLCLLLPGDL